MLEILLYLLLGTLGVATIGMCVLISPLLAVGLTCIVLGIWIIKEPGR